MLVEVIEEARDARIPVPSAIYPHVSVNSRPKKRFGCCKREGRRYVIELSSFVLTCEPHLIKGVLAHEVLHTCRDCDNHGNKWKMYAAVMNERYGYNIKRTTSFGEMGLDEPEPKENRIRYVMKCQQCGKEYPRERFTCVMKKINAYRCNCGGKLVVYEVEHR